MIRRDSLLVVRSVVLAGFLALASGLVGCVAPGTETREPRPECVPDEPSLLFLGGVSEMMQEPKPKDPPARRMTESDLTPAAPTPTPAPGRKSSAPLPSHASVASDDLSI